MGSLYQNVFRGWCFSSNSSYHRGGRIVVAWNPMSFQVDIMFISSQLMHCYITGPAGRKFFCTFLYAFNDAHGRREAWEDLEKLVGLCKGPWIILGDFNCVMSNEERIGARVRQQDMEDLRRCMAQCGMQDLTSTGNLFTWNNKQEGDCRVYSKLDRAMVNDDWYRMFPTSAAHFMPKGLFDHSPIVVNVYPARENNRRPFKYFTMWSLASSFSQLIQEGWNQDVQGTPMYKVVKKIKEVKLRLKKLNQEGFSDIESQDIKAARYLQECQEQLKENPGDKALSEAERKASVEYRSKHQQYMSFLAQKAKLAWCKDGDENSSLFHNAIKARRLQNTVYAINNSRGEWQEGV
ncbi:uncharacterized protein LOC125494693 [Beta vulgaris subsp. vulgaris]|uniref:uncharacterized protein LOC125494693 n=1 Tax=Beta vulgaris subsp. vulgaris TaxID=3555 RepID=UPI00203676BE|nr:uncharacterized protein LOC125494693 [Beta vulgaris subsp. vulgaris]